MADKLAMMGHPLCRGTEFRLVSRENLPEDLSRAMVRGMVQFLDILSESELELSPPTLIDTAWHEALIDTVNYRNFCSTFFGKILDHHPPIDDRDFRIENFDLTRKTVELARHRFGDQLEVVVWRRSKRVRVLAQAL